MKQGRGWGSGPLRHSRNKPEEQETKSPSRKRNEKNTRTGFKSPSYLQQKIQVNRVLGPHQRTRTTHKQMCADQYTNTVATHVQQLIHYAQVSKPKNKPQEAVTIGRHWATNKRNHLGVIRRWCWVDNKGCTVKKYSKIKGCRWQRQQQKQCKEGE